MISEIPQIEYPYNNIGDRYLSKKLKENFAETFFDVLCARISKLDILSAFLCLSVIKFLMFILWVILNPRY